MYVVSSVYFLPWSLIIIVCIQKKKRACGAYQDYHNYSFINSIKIKKTRLRRLLITRLPSLFTYQCATLQLSFLPYHSKISVGFRRPLAAHHQRTIYEHELKQV